MAKIKRGILGGFSGKIGGVVGTSWKGRAIMKALPLSVANPKTEGQVRQRTSFSLVSQLFSILLTYITRPVYNPISGDITGSNKATSQNKLMFDGSGVFDPANSFIGGGTLLHSPATAAVFAASGNNVDIEWIDTSDVGSPRKTDNVYAFAYIPALNTLYARVTPPIRSVEATVLPIISGEVPVPGTYDVYVFIAYVSEDGREVSVVASPTLFSVTL